MLTAASSATAKKIEDLIDYPPKQTSQKDSEKSRGMQPMLHGLSSEKQVLLFIAYGLLREN
ncbi:hypothetical protein [Erwinia amylovora]|uniref:hypothetical protein n=1 Tax=Erwinia amylovora TaxID=552 RepID=UPI000C0769BE|nr:hypothetical protein [Erwinia amylovora]